MNSLLFYEALLKAKVPAEMHLYPYGVHGMSLATEEVRQDEKKRLPDVHLQRWLDAACA